MLGQKAKILGSERITTNTIEIKTPLGDRVAGESFERATNKNLSKRDAAANAVQFRDAYYARLNDRVDEWMDKVNTMSLRDINRYQFRRDRSDEPGFPVQRAGMGDAGNVRSNKMPLTSGLSPKPKPSSIPAVGQYWMGPKTSKSSGKSTVSSDDNDLGNRPITSQSQPGKRNYKAVPKPILGPKTIRVEVGTAE